MTPPQRSQRRARAARAYALLLRLYPRIHREAFGEQMLQAFADHYRDVVEVHGETEARFWVRVVSDAGKSLLREHIAASVERIWPMQTLLMASTFGLWRQRRTRKLALVIQLGLIAAVLLVWAPLLLGPVAIAAGLQGMVHATPGIDSYYLSAAVERPTSQFVATFTQGATDIAAGELHAYHFSASRVEISTFPLALAGASATLPPILLDGEPAARLTSDVRMVQGRLPMPASDVLEVAVTQSTADQLHLALGATVPIAATSVDRAPLVRVVGVVQTGNATTFPIDRRTFDPNNQDVVRYYAQQNPLDYVLTSDEAIGAYTYDWSQVQSVQTFYNHGGPDAQPLPPSENPPLWQAWWVGTADYSRMNAQDLKAVVSDAVPDPTLRFNQLLGEPSLAQQTGFVSAYTSSGFWQGDDYGDYEDETTFLLILAWLLPAAVAGALVFGLRPIVGRLVERQQPLIAALQERGASRRRVLGALGTQALVQAAIALLVGGLLAVVTDRLIAPAVVPPLAQPGASLLVGSPFDSGFGIAGGIAAVLILLVTVLVLLRVMSHALALARTGETSATSG